MNLKFKLGHIPSLCDFYHNADFNPELILKHNKFPCYHLFLKHVEKDYLDTLDEWEVNSLNFLSQNIINSMRPHEALILKCLITNNHFNMTKIEKLLKSLYQIENDMKSIESGINILNLNFFTDKEKKKYGEVEFFDEEYKITPQFRKHLNNNSYKKHLNDIIDYVFLKYSDVYCPRHNNINMKLYAKYSRKDVCRLLNWNHDDSSTMYGYRIKHGTCPIFVTYDKNDDISESTKYKDEFISKEVFSWMTRSRVKLESKEAQSIINDNLQIHIFVKKSDDEGKKFYYIGDAIPLNWNETRINNDKGESLPIVNFKYKLNRPVNDELYDYFTNES